jgi:hypothetical protein
VGDAVSQNHEIAFGGAYLEEFKYAGGSIDQGSVWIMGPLVLVSAIVHSCKLFQCWKDEWLEEVIPKDCFVLEE